MSADPFPDKDEHVGEYHEKKIKPPPPWMPKDETYAKRVVPMPAWAREFARTGRLPPESERRSNASGLPPEEIQEHADRAAYEARWRSIKRDIVNLKAEAARACLANPATSEIAKAASARSAAVDDERDRLGALYRKGAPLTLRSFPPLDVPLAGASLERAERAAAAEPLFVAPPDAFDVGEFIV